MCHRNSIRIQFRSTQYVRPSHVLKYQRRYLHNNSAWHSRSFNVVILIWGKAAVVMHVWLLCRLPSKHWCRSASDIVHVILEVHTGTPRAQYVSLYSLGSSSALVHMIDRYDLRARRSCGYYLINTAAELLKALRKSIRIYPKDLHTQKNGTQH